MATLVGYAANRTDRLSDALGHERNALLAPGEDVRPSGWGIGFYQGGEVLHKKRPLLASESLDWSQIASNVRSDCVVLYLREAGSGDFHSDDMHPFRMRSWLFGHNGPLVGFPGYRANLFDSLPDFLRRNIRGDTDGEHLFHLVLSFLHDAGQLDNPDVDDVVVLHAIRASLSLVDRLAAEVGAPPSKLSMLLTNGRRMYAVRRGQPLAWVERRGIETGQDARDAATLRYVMVVGDGAAPPEGYREIDDRHVLVVGRDLESKLVSL